MTTSPRQTDRFGTLTETDEGWAVRYERHLAQPPAVAWRAFTDPALVAEWFPSTIDGDLTAGAPLRFVIRDHDVEPFVGTVLEVDEPHRLVFMWGPDRLDFVLAAADGGTDLTVIVVMTEQGKVARDGAGWHECLDNLVNVHASAGEEIEVEAWRLTNALYAERFGPDASTIGPPPGMLDDSDA